MEYMATLPDKAFDLAIVDPPYGIQVGINGTVGTDKCAPCTQYKPVTWDNMPPSKQYFNELIRVSKNQVIFGGNYFIDNLYSTPCMIVWDKQNSGGFADCELAWTSFKTAVRKITFMWNGMLQGNMKEKEIRIHPTQKPKALYGWILNNYAKPGQRILDTHLGSGSSAIAAHYFGCDFVGCEIDVDYFNAAKERFDRETRQLALW
jgi:site-specific DNA-methyltransferase (adenine-specific)